MDVAPCDSGMSFVEEYMTTLMKIEFDNSLSLSQTRRNVANQMIDIIPVSIMPFHFIFQPSVVDSLLIVDTAPCDLSSSSFVEQYMTTLMKIQFDNSLSLSQMRRNVANQMIDIIPVSSMLAMNCLHCLSNLFALFCFAKLRLKLCIILRVAKLVQA